MSKRQMKTLYVVSSGEYSDYRVLAAFESEGHANDWRDAIRADEDGWNRDAFVEQLELVPNSMKPAKRTLFVKSAELLDTGEVEEREISETSDWFFGHRAGGMSDRPSVRYVRAPCHKDQGGRLEIEGFNRDAVLKVFSERLAKWRAGAFGGPTVKEICE